MRLTKRRRIESYIRDFGADEFFARAKILFEADQPDGRVLIGHCHHPRENGPPYPNGFELDLKKFYAKRVASCTDFDRDEVIRRVRETTEKDGGRVSVREKTTKEPEITVGGMQIRPVSLEELGVEPDQGTASRMTIRNLDRTIMEVIKARLGAESDAEAVRKALTVAGQVLVKE